LAPYNEHQVVLRTERFHVPATCQDAQVVACWSPVLAEARRRTLTGVWLLHDQPEQLVSLVYFADRAESVERSAPLTPDARAPLALALEQAPPLGDVFAEQGWTRTFDRTQLVLTLWFPAELGDHGRPAVWPNSPPLPGPMDAKRE
jgi:hypothetical protein